MDNLNVKVKVNIFYRSKNYNKSKLIKKIIILSLIKFYIARTYPSSCRRGKKEKKPFYLISNPKISLGNIAAASRVSVLYTKL